MGSINEPQENNEQEEDQNLQSFVGSYGPSFYLLNKNGSKQTLRAAIEESLKENIDNYQIKPKENIQKIETTSTEADEKSKDNMNNINNINQNNKNNENNSNTKNFKEKSITENTSRCTNNNDKNDIQTEENLTEDD